MWLYQLISREDVYRSARDASMQFTELSELNHVVEMTRMSSCNSPTFHDRQDSEVDRIYNSSPKMEHQLRNSWIDKLASFKAPPPSAKKQSSFNNKTAGAVASNVPAVAKPPESVKKPTVKDATASDGAAAVANGTASVAKITTTSTAKKGNCHSFRAALLEGLS